MKKFMRTAVLALIAAMMMGLTAFAAPVVQPENNYVVSAFVDADGNKLSSIAIESKVIVEDGQYMIFVVDGDMPTADSILYINQTQADEAGKVEFYNVFPSEMKNSNIMLSGTGMTGPVVVAKIVVEGEKPDVMVGDINGDQQITAADAQEILKYAAALDSLIIDEDIEYWMNIADINGDGQLTAADAQEILKYAASLDSALDS